MSVKKQWFQEFLICFRKKQKTLSKKDKRLISNINNFNSPCQIELIQFKEPEYQILFVTHFKHIPDMTISTYKTVPIKDIINKLSNWVKDKKWDVPLPKEIAKFHVGDPSRIKIYYRSELERILTGVYDIIQQNLKLVYKNPFEIFCKLAFEQDFFWLIRGDITTKSPTEIFETIIEEGKKNLARKKAKLKKEPIKIKGHGTFFYPPIWIGDIPKSIFKERLGVESFNKYCTKSMNVRYRKKQLVIYKDGQISISEINREKALRILNEIMAVSILKEIPCFIIRDFQLQDIQIDLKTFEIVSTSGPLGSFRGNLLFSRFDVSKVLSPFFGRTNVTVKKIKEIIKISEKIDNRIDSDLLILNLEAYTHFKQAEYFQAFIFSWVVIEKYLSIIWKKYIEESEIKGERKKKLLKSRDWSISTIIETLSLVGKINKEDYEIYNYLRKKRNGSIHEGKIITEEDAVKCLGMSFKIFSDIIGKIK